MRKRAASSGAAGGAHRPGSLKASNKAHKSGRHKSNRSLKRTASGKVAKVGAGGGVGAQGARKAPKKALSRVDKKNRQKLLRLAKAASKQQQQEQQQQQQEEATAQAADASASTPAGQAPLLVSVVSLCSEVSQQLLMSLVRSADPDGGWQRAGRRRLRLDSASLKRQFLFEFVPACGAGPSSFWPWLDAAKVADILLLVFDRSAEVSQFEASLSALYAQGLPQQTHVLLLASSDSLKEKKLWEKFLSDEMKQKFALPGNDCVVAAQSGADVRRLLQRLSAKRNLTKTGFAEARCHGLVERATAGAGGAVRVETFVRGGLSAGHLLHVVGCGDFAVEAVAPAPAPIFEAEEANANAEVLLPDADVAMEADEADAEADTARLTKEQQQQLDFPDEVDTPRDEPARSRFAKYQPAPSLQACQLRKFDDLPEVYASLAYFSNFQHARNRVAKRTKAETTDVANCYASLSLRPLQPEAAESLTASGGTLVWHRLLEHEEKLTLVNANVRQLTGQAMRSKRPIVWQVGWRRYAARPIFSEHSLQSDKHLYLRRLPCGQQSQQQQHQQQQHYVASFYAPLTYTPAPVLGFDADAKKLLLAGTVVSCDPGRVIVKRVVLSGHPFKVHKRSAVVRYLFFNAEDAIHYKPTASLRTKRGRRGEILEPVGTHGLVKCKFDGQVTNMDTVLLDLYRRQFPKLTYRPL